MKQSGDEVLEFLREYPDAIGDLARRLREVVQGAVPGAQEVLDRTGRVIGYGFGPGYSGLVCTIIPSKKGVKLGVVHGARLADPHALLDGAGKQHRYVAFANPEDLRKPGLRELLCTAVAAYKERTKPRT